MKFQPWPVLAGLCVFASAVLADAPPAVSASSSAASQPALFSYRPPAPVPTPLPAVAVPANLEHPKIGPAAIGAPEASSPPPDTAVQMDTYKVHDPVDRYVRDLGPELARGPLIPPRALYTKNLANGMMLEVLCAPIDPVPGESPAEAHQARFPLVSLDW